MAVIACVFIEPTEAVRAVCAQLTPVVEPLSDRIFMDWTGCGPVPKLARQLEKQLHVLGIGPGPAGKPGADRGGYHIGVAPLRFVAEILATSDWNIPHAGIAGGYYIPENALSDFLQDLPIDRMPDVDENHRRTLQGLAVNTLGQLRSIRTRLLRSHIGSAADPLLDRARGHDPRTVAPLYPPERLRTRISGELMGDALTGDVRHLLALVEEHVEPLISQLQGANRAATHVAVYGAGERHVRTFAEPMTDEMTLRRVVGALTERFVSRLLRNEHVTPTKDVHDIHGNPDEAEAETSLRLEEDLIVEIIPTNSASRQMTLWNDGQPRDPRRERLQKVLDSLRNRFGNVIGFTGPREAVARYEAMLHLYEAKG